MWDSNTTHPQVSRCTVQRAMADQGYCKFRAKRRLKISASTAGLRLKLAADWQGFNLDATGSGLATSVALLVNLATTLPGHGD